MRPKDIGTRFETAVVRYLIENGWPYAERRALAGTNDLGDITGTPGIAWECKAGTAATTAGDGAIYRWMNETERQRASAKADVGVLVVARKGIGAGRIGNVWAIVPADTFPKLAVAGPAPVRLHLAAMCRVLRANGYGEPLTVDELRRAPMPPGAAA